MTNTIHSILRQYATKQGSAQVNFADFSEYMKRYAQHHLEDKPEMHIFLSNPQEEVMNCIQPLINDGRIVLNAFDIEKKFIIVVSYFIDKITLRFKEIEANPAIPFPNETDLPKNLHIDIYQKKTAADFIYELFNHQTLSNDYLYGFVFPRDLPEMLFPSTLSIDKLLETALAKIRFRLRKEEYHDYFLKKIRIANPGKEIAAKNFFTQATTKPVEALEAIKTSSDAFYFWSQLCYFMRLDYEKVKELQGEDISLLQSIFIVEISINYFKNKHQQNLQKTTALRNLEQIMNKPPYYFSMETILKLTDHKGIPLLGQYSQDDLNAFLHEATTSVDKTNLPPMLVFKTENQQRYFIYKTKVIPLVIKLCNDVREMAKTAISTEWQRAYKQFETLPEMKDQKAFEEKLEQVVKHNSPILYALLTSNFLSLVAFENKTDTDSSFHRIQLFSNGKLLPYSELLMISRQELVTDVQMLLPFWYTIPVFSWIAALFLKQPKKKAKKTTEKASLVLQKEETEPQETTQKKESRAKLLKESIIELEKDLIPDGSTLAAELKSSCKEWNRMLNKQAYENLTEDVNSLIKDYLRRTLRSSRFSTFTHERMQNLAETLAKTPNLQKIQNTDALIRYIQLYFIKLLKK